MKLTKCIVFLVLVVVLSKSALSLPGIAVAPGCIDFVNGKCVPKQVPVNTLTNLTFRIYNYDSIDRNFTILLNGTLSNRIYLNQNTFTLKQFKGGKCVEGCKEINLLLNTTNLPLSIYNLKVSVSSSSPSENSLSLVEQIISRVIINITDVNPPKINISYKKIFNKVNFRLLVNDDVAKNISCVFFVKNKKDFKKYAEFLLDNNLPKLFTIKTYSKIKYVVTCNDGFNNKTIDGKINNNQIIIYMTLLILLIGLILLYFKKPLSSLKNHFMQNKTYLKPKNKN